MLFRNFILLFILENLFACKEANKSKKNLSDEEALYGVNTNAYGINNGTGSVMAMARIPISLIMQNGINSGYMGYGPNGSQFGGMGYSGMNGMNGFNNLGYGGAFGQGVNPYVYCFYKVDLELELLKKLVKKRKNLESTKTVPKLWEVVQALRSLQLQYSGRTPNVQSFYFDTEYLDNSVSQSNAELFEQLRDGFNRERDKEKWIRISTLYQKLFQQAATYPQAVQQALNTLVSQRRVPVAGQPQAQAQVRSLSQQELLMARQQIELQMRDWPRLGCPSPLVVYRQNFRDGPDPEAE